MIYQMELSKLCDDLTGKGQKEMGIRNGQWNEARIGDGHLYYLYILGK